MATTAGLTLFDKMLAQGVREGKLPARTFEARNWFRERALTTRTTKEAIEKMARGNRMRTTPVVGRMYFFRYDAKTKKDLPYWDAFPLIFPIKRVHGENNAFLGINLHYLPLVYRAKLMDRLYNLTTNEKFDQTTKLKISYQILQGASQLKYFKPCIKKYLMNHVRSDFVEVYSAEWDIGLFLPIADWRKATQQEVWKDSREMIFRS